MSELTLKENKKGDSITATIVASPMEIMRAFADKYELILEVGDVMIYQGNPYITKSGLLRISHVQKCKAVMPKCKTIDYQKGFAHYECIVTTHDDRVYRDEGFCSRTEPGKKRTMHEVIGMAITRARNRAIGAATATPYCSKEEMPTKTKFKDVVEMVNDE